MNHIPVTVDRHVVVDDSFYILCAVEGCERTQPGGGQDGWCGLAKLKIEGPTHHDMTCGAAASVDHWYTFDHGITSRPCEFQHEDTTP